MIKTNSKKVEYYGKIWYTMGENHPSREYIKNFSTLEVHTYEDIYRFDFNHFYSDDIDEIKAYIEHDLMLVASGGSSLKNIEPIVFDIHKI